MYCKICGNKIEYGSNRCSSCGNVINTQDGGQSFYEEYDLTEWRTITPTPVQASVPVTTVKDANNFSAPNVVRTPVRKRKKKKSVFDLSNSNKFIIFCIVSVVAIVLLATAILLVIGNITGDDEIEYDDKFVETQVSGDYLQENAESGNSEETPKQSDNGTKKGGGSSNKGNSNPAKVKPSDTKSAETKPAETKPAGSKQVETKPAETKPAETKPAETKPAETKPAETKPADTKPADTKPAETKPAETKPAETKPAETKPAETKPVETKPAETKPAETKGRKDK